MRTHTARCRPVTTQLNKLGKHTGKTIQTRRICRKNFRRTMNKCSKRCKKRDPVAARFMEMNHPVSFIKYMGIEKICFVKDRQRFGEIAPYAGGILDF